MFADEAPVVATRSVAPLVVQPRPDVDTGLRTTLDVVVRLSSAPEREVHAPLFPVASTAELTPPILVWIAMFHTPSRPQTHTIIMSSLARTVSCV